MKKLIPKSAINRENVVRDSLKDKTSKLYDGKYNLELLREARDVWMGWEPVRETRARNIRYALGDQWGDLVKDENGKMVTERSRIAKRTGGVVLQNNHIFKVLNTMSGIYVKSSGKPVCYAMQEDSDRKASVLTNAIQKNYDNNLMEEVMTNALYEMLVGGFPVLSPEWGRLGKEQDNVVYTVNPDYFALRTKGVDPRMWDVDFMVEIRDYTKAELKAELAKSDYDSDQLDIIYAPYMKVNYPDLQQLNRHENVTFETPPGTNLCRTYRIWTLEYKPRYRVTDLLDMEEPIYKIEIGEKWKVDAMNEERKAEYIAQGITDESEMILIETQYIQDEYWHCWILAPDGRVLDDFDSPYEHGSFPYVFTADKYFNGNIYPFLSVIIDQQRYVNRLITLQDLLISSNINGLKMVPKTMLGGLTPKEFTRRAVELGGWIFYEPDPEFPNLMPTIIQNNSRDVGIAELLRIQLESIDDITNMSSAIRGGTPQSGTPASRYALETENSITALAATYRKFNTFENNVAKKVLSNILQYYTEPRRISVWHTNGVAEHAMMRPEDYTDAMYDVVVRQAPDTPVARMTNNELFKEMWLRGILNTKQLLQYSDLPGTEELKQDLEASEEAVQAGQAPQQLSGENAQRATDGADTDTVSAIQQALRRDLGSLTNTGMNS